MKTRRIPPQEKRYIDLKAELVDLRIMLTFCSHTQSVIEITEMLKEVRQDLEKLEFDKRMECNLSD